MGIVGIYKITNPSGKIYIGQSINIKYREKQYKNLASNIKPQIGIYRSILKHGWKKHKFEIIEECSLNNLNKRERYWQDYYGVLEFGLNCILTKTKDKSGICSLETKKRKSKAAPTRPVIQYSLKGKRIKRWKKIIDVERILGIANQTITNCCKDIKNSAGGYIWVYEDKPKIVKPVRSAKYGFPINQYNMDGKFIKEWKSAKEASINLKIDNGSISNVCQGKNKSAGGYIWKFK